MGVGLKIILVMAMAIAMVIGEAQVPCYFIFGDSLVDNGNNNDMLTFAKANYFPYGIDFPDGPTGRFTNGKTTVDVIGELLGFEDYIPPYDTADGQQILKGVNYASAAAGIRPETGRQLGGRTYLTGQVNHHKGTVEQVVSMLGDKESASNHLGKCIYLIIIGSNDYLNNYFMPLFYSTGSRYSPEEYADDLIRRYTDQLKVLYECGARKYVLIGVGPIGCTPNVLAQRSPDGSTCVHNINDAIEIFNAKLKSTVDLFNQRKPDAKYIFINAYGIFQDLAERPSAFGFKVTNAGCCGVGRNHGQITCMPLQPPCQNREEHLFWDAFHPSEAANVLVGRRAYKGQNTTDVYPYDISRLAQL